MQVPAGMELRFTFENAGKQPVYLNIEPVPDRYMLRPGDKIEFYATSGPNDGPPVIYSLESEITIWPNTTGADLTLLNGENAELRSWSN